MRKTIIKIQDRLNNAENTTMKLAQCKWFGQRDERQTEEQISQRKGEGK
jgi:hypothetical protein